MKLRKQAFLRDLQKELAEENVAVFAGAGMSAGSGFVNWAELLRPIAEELGLDVDKENDLVALAQFHCNDNANNRSQLNQRLIEEFSRKSIETENHRILCRLPIRTYWTTNYDKLIENALEKSGKIADVKHTKEHLSTTKPKRDAVVYKMHGDVEHASQAVLTKDDYERYHVKMEQYLANLKSDLISKTFIFIGFSFTDPNLDYILSRVRVAYENNQRRHYCFIRNIKKYKNEEIVDFEYRQRKQDFFVKDLERFNIKTIIIDEYEEITELLRKLEIKYKSRTIFISGAACEYGDLKENEALRFVYDLSKRLVKNNLRVVSGFGVGIGSTVISSVLEETFNTKLAKIEDHLVLRPFPQSTEGVEPLGTLWTKYREDMINYAGIALFLFGNKKSDSDVILSNGMREEYEIAKKQGLLLLPIGSTGYMARELWSELNDEIQNSSTASSKMKRLYERLGTEQFESDSVIELIMEIIELMDNEQ
ncbi:SIR2 family protein [Vibrio parahaemolyticus]|uniref:SIR2 family protein n=2 Tax=Vibrio parahaemolyticus TaxID=670 RepID=UPI0004494736|nr:SIR2 family protein [Vibrio parahaemolyticus]ETZ11576.1 USG protein [Vibrio parahaemolyticus M0605]EIY6409022.1 SIR2 family protein [Vibrio parahaemolyticus]EJE8566535.1 SIR2 family protein [Vibrio parahaemolyticus]ELA9304305.1 SIR2 family protein [Vibrio parahaemolyticus]ELB2077066.1 SIR2 family protein [Vibrio parahaemolyticus]